MFHGKLSNTFKNNATSTGILIGNNIIKNDLLNSTVYATINCNYGHSSNNVRNSINQNLCFYQKERETFCNDSLKSTFSSNLAIVKNSLPTLDESLQLNDIKTVSDKDNKIHIRNVTPMVSINPNSRQRFIVPSRRPIAVSALVPTMGTFDLIEPPITHTLSVSNIKPIDNGIKLIFSILFDIIFYFRIFFKH